MRYDTLLSRHLALELNSLLAGERLDGVRFDAGAQTLFLAAARTHLLWDLHPQRGHLVQASPLIAAGQPLILPRRCVVRSVEAMTDERIVFVRWHGEPRAGASYAVVVELLTNQWNALALDDADRVMRVLKPRAQGRRFQRGHPYEPPLGNSRTADLSLSDWQELLATTDPREAYIARCAHASPINADRVLAAPDPATSFARWRELLDAPGGAYLLSMADSKQPYSHHLWLPDAQPQPSLLAAMGVVAAPTETDALVRQLERRLRQVEKKQERLTAQLRDAEANAQRNRTHADLLLAYSAEVPKGAAEARLTGFDGNALQIAIDPALSAVENAQRLYHEARKQERAAQTVPTLLADAEQRHAALSGLITRARAGTLKHEEVAKLMRERPRASGAADAEARLPYRRYRTSGGLEVRVGRSARANDDLTLHHASPRDIWLHARDAAGAHVVLRWSDAEANPPQRDLVEAAVLAALHSRARTSGTVPVDWTRRKYVRKPRKSPPGQVIMERGKTIFVEPDTALEKRLRWPDAV